MVNLVSGHGDLVNVKQRSPLLLRTPRPATEPRNGPIRNFHEKHRKKSPPARNSGLPEFTPKIARKYRKNIPKIPKMRIFGIFSVFSWRSRISARGVFFRYFFSWKFRVRPSRGSVAGRGVLNTFEQFLSILVSMKHVMQDRNARMSWSPEGEAKERPRLTLPLYL